MQALLQMEENEGYSNIVFDKTLRGAGLDHRESALAATLFYGVLEKRLVLDWLLQPFCKKPLENLTFPCGKRSVWRYTKSIFWIAYRILRR